MIIVDYSQTVISTIFAELSGAQLRDVKSELNLLRHMVINSILSYKKKYSAQYGEMIICCDGSNNWRKSVFQYYKASRSTNREKDETDWDGIFHCMSVIREELNQFFPYKVLHVDGAEADDLIATLAKWSQTNDLVESMFGDEPKPFLILSRDGDFVQLQKYSNVSQYSPISKKWIKPEISPEKDLAIKLVTGDAGDGVPSVLCPDDFFVNKEKYGRAKPVNQKVKDRFINEPHTLNEEEKERLERNRTMIDLDCIPVDVQNGIISKFESLQTKNKSQLMSYFIKNRMKLLLDSLSDF